MKHKTGFVLIVIGGILMIISSTVGSVGVFQFLYDFAAAEWPDYEPIFYYVLTIIRWIADLGGVAVIAGAVLILLGALKLGKLIVYIGLAFGTLALVIWVISQVINVAGIVVDPYIADWLDKLYTNYSYGTGLAFAGVVIAIIGRKAAVKRKPKKVKEEVEEEIEVEEEVEEKRKAEIEEGLIEEKVGEEVEDEIKEEEEEGEDEEAAKPLEKKFCPECGTELPPFANFCSNCGKTFD